MATLWSCTNKGECLALPSEIAIQIIDGTLTYPADLDTAARIKVSYQESGQQKYIADLGIIGDEFHSSMLIEASRKANDPEFSFELNGRILSKMKMETYIEKSRCSGWARISKVYQNGEVIAKSPNGAYIIE